MTTTDEIRSKAEFAAYESHEALTQVLEALCDHIDSLEGEVKQLREDLKHAPQIAADAKARRCGWDL